MYLDLKEIKILEDYLRNNRGIISELSDSGSILLKDAGFGVISSDRYRSSVDKEIFDLSSDVIVEKSTDGYVITIKSAGRFPHRIRFPLTEELILQILRENKLDQIL